MNILLLTGCLVIFIVLGFPNNISCAGLNSPCNVTANCSSVANAVCDAKTCQCNVTFKADKQKCVLKVIGKQCTVATESTDCTLENSVCKTSTCACKPGFKDNADACLKILGTACNSGNAASVCNVTNAECATDKCACQEHYVEENGLCHNALGQSCTVATNCVSNAICDQICKCKEGMIDTNGLCAKPSSAPSNKKPLCTMGILMMLIIFLK